TDGQRIVQRDRLEDRAQLVEAVVTPAEHAQRQIDFREGADAHRLAAARSGRREPAGAPQIVEADAFRIARNIDAASFGAERDVRLDLRKRQLDVEAAAVSADESNDGRKPVLVAIVIDAPARLLAFARIEDSDEVPRRGRRIAMQVDLRAAAARGR